MSEISELLSEKLQEQVKRPEINTLAELQKTASQVQRASKDAEWEGITTYNSDDIPPIMMAKLYAALPWGPGGGYLTIPQALMLAIAAHDLKLKPEYGDIFILPSGKVGFSLQGMLKSAINNGHKLSAPKYTEVKRKWPSGLKLEFGFREKKKEFDLPEEPGVTCEMQINGHNVSFTVWLTEWYMPGNPNWYSRMDWMMRVQGQKRCLALGTGIAVSEEITDTDVVSSTTEKGEYSRPKISEAKAPSTIPTGR